MTHDPQCRWVNRRLPLLAGGELDVLQRRKVERHLIVCHDCRDRRDATVEALMVLRGVRGESPASIDAPSLWPALARQIRQSRHVPKAPAPPWWDDLLPRPWGFVGVATALTVVLLAAIAPPARLPVPAPVLAPVVAFEEEVSIPVVDLPAPMTVPEVVATPRRPRSALPESPNGALTQIKPVEPPSSILRFDYDLDHGTPTTPGNHDPQRTF